MKDEELKREEIEVSHTLGGSVRCYTSSLSYTLKYVISRIFPITDEPVYMCE